MLMIDFIAAITAVIAASMELIIFILPTGIFLLLFFYSR